MSLVVSLTVTPMMCARLLRHEKNSQKHAIRDHYARSLGWVLQHPTLMLFITFATIALTLLLAIVVPKGFFPQQDTGRIMSSIQAEQDMSFQAIQQKFNDFIRIIKQDEGVEHVVGFVGSSNNIFITLKPLSQRKISADAVINRLRVKLAHIPGATLYMQAAQDLVIGGRLGNAQFQYTLSGDKLEDLNHWAPKVMERLSKLPGIIDVNSDQRDKGLEVYVDIDHDTAARFGITPAVIDETLYDAFGQRQVSTLFTPLNQYHIVMEVAPRFWQRPQTLNDIYVPSVGGQLIPLSTFVRFSTNSTLLAVNHQGQFPSATLSFNLLPGISLGDVVDRVTQAVDEIHMPNTIQGKFQGTVQAFQASKANQPYLIVAALLAVYIVLGILYESMVHPITILSTLPSAGVGALLALLLTRTDLTVIALIGIILLIGIVKKNAIMMIDFALQIERTENKSPRDAIYQAAILRFRPIMMTTMAAMLSALPLALGTGVGAELRRPLGIAIVGGLLVSQMLTLFTTPVIYLSLEQFSQWSRKHIAALRVSQQPSIVGV